MTEPTPTNPSPTAIPWTPDMMSPQSHLATQPPAHPPQPEHYQAQHQQPGPAQAQPHYAHRPSQPTAQAYAPQPQHMAAPQLPQHVPTQSQMMPAQFVPQARMAPPQAPLPHPGQAQPQLQHYSQAQFGQAPLNPSQPIPQRPQAGPPPLAPHMHTPVPIQNAAPDTGSESKSPFAKLLKRSPKPMEAQSDMTAPNSGSLFNKNFALGALTGLVIGAFVLPMALNMIGGDAPVQTQAQVGPASIIETTPTITEGDTFIDEAIAADAP